jgi:uncharacterized membrane protein
MQGKSVGVGEAVSWIGCGWGIFTKSPGIWIVMALILGLGGFILLIIPLINLLVMLALMVLWPVLLGGLLYAASQADEGKPVEIGHLFEGFRQSDKMGSLILLALIVMGVSIVMSIIIFLLMGGSAMMSLMMGQSRGAAAGMGAGFIVGMLLNLFMSILIMMATWFAVPLIMLRGSKVMEAVKDSFNASVTNLIPLIVLYLIWIVMAIVATIPFGLGWLVLFPVTWGMQYCSYRRVFA